MTALSVANGDDFVQLMRRYVVDYTNRHDQTITADLMEPEYVLRMGPHWVTGRDTAYRAATRKQLDQFPGLGLTVHEIWTSGERLVMRFSEHGASVRHGGRRCAWGGIGLYAWNGTRLTSNHVEQNYWSRARQLDEGVAHPVEGPALAPWDTRAESPVAAHEAVVRAWLEAGGLASTPGVVCDDGWTGAPVPRLVEQRAIEFNDLFSCGAVVAFHVTQRGVLATDADLGATTDREVTLYSAGLARVASGGIVSGRVIRNRTDLKRSLGA